MRLRQKKTHALAWLLEPLEDHPTYLRKKMFGCEAAYLNGKLTIVLAAGDEPWNGLLIATDRKFHSALKAQWNPLAPHAVLGKWLYLSQSHHDFEEIATAVVDRVKREDPRIGVESKPRKEKRHA